MVVNMNHDKITETSRKHWDFVIQENLTAKEAVAFMKNGIKLRTFKDNLQDFYSGNDLEERLIYGLSNYTGKSEQSIQRKVNNWMQNRNLPSDREELFCICFLLELNEIVSDYLLKRLTGEGIHYRNIRELVYAYCLKYQKKYEQAKALIDKIIESDTAKRDETGISDIKYNQENFFTGIVKLDFQSLCNNEELLEFILERKSQMGNYHNTAYKYFKSMLELLTKENDKKIYSVEKVVDSYLRLNMPIDKRTSHYSYIQKLVKKHWPGNRSVKAMKNRTCDVTRKVLLLLYIVTGGVYYDFYEEIDEEDISSDEFLEFHCKNMNSMLNECGMGRIDPRNAFDFLILYSIRPEKNIFMSDRMAEIIDELYQDIYSS